MTNILQDTELGATFVWLGQGGFCVVYEAIAPGIAPFAIKLARSELPPEEVAIGELFIRNEAAILSRLSRVSGVVGFQGADLDSATLFLDRVPGKDLHVALSIAGPPPVARTIRIGLRIAKVLVLCADLGVIHADIKPANVVSGRNGRVKVIDFGASRLLPSSVLRHVTNNYPIEEIPDHVFDGSASYSSPEQVLGQPATPAWDMYSFGMTLYELLAGHLPFDGDDVEAVKLQQVTEQPRPVSQAVPDIPPLLADLITACLAKAPDHRPTAAEAASALAWLKC